MRLRHRPLPGGSAGYRAWLLVLGAIAFAGWLGASEMAEHGHRVTGMNNKVVWGIPHVVAIFLILCASGALHAASLSSILRRPRYAPVMRFSLLCAGSALLGGLCIVVLDLGRPERFTIAMTHFNFRSQFAWNIALYAGFMVMVTATAWVHTTRSTESLGHRVGVLALAWRLVMTAGTGAIFGVLAARGTYPGVATMVPLFIANSVAAGVAVFLLAAAVAFRAGRCRLDDRLVHGLGRALAVSVVVVVGLVAATHGFARTGSTAGAVSRFVLMDGGLYTFVFWVVQILLGTLLPLLLLRWPSQRGRRGRTLVAAALVAIGVLGQLYVLLIAGQAFPHPMISGYEILDGPLFDARVAPYRATMPEYALGAGGIAVAAALVTLGLRILPILPAPPAEPVARERRTP